MISFLDSKILNKFIPIFIFLLAFLFRIYGINWDQNQHLHPDERFLTMTVDVMVWPSTLGEYLNPSVSKLNPYNIKTMFFVYGTLPTTVVKYFSNYNIFNKYQYNNITLTGRLISALFDSGVVILVFFIAKAIYSRKVGLLASFLYSIMVLPIQLSHFFAVDTFLNFFLVLSFYFLIKLISKKKIYYGVLLGLSYGASLACKISALYFFPIIFLGLLFIFINIKKLVPIIYCSLLIALFTFISLRIFDPHVFSGGIFNPKINPQFIKNILELRSQGNRDSLFPPAIQWLKITPIIFPVKNIILWGLGLPLGILSVIAVIHSSFIIISNLIKKTKTGIIPGDILIIFWIIFLLFYQGIQFTPSMRYFLPIYPFLAIIFAKYSITFLFYKSKKNNIPYIIFLILLLIWPLSFLSIYSRSHSRVLASDWIYQNIPSGSTLSCDSWDDCLPLNIENVGFSNQYKILSMEPFTPDTPEKQIKFKEQLGKLDYLVLTSNRAWGSLSKVPDKFPFMSVFYEDLFAGKLNFTKVAEITSYPTIPLLNIPIPDQSSEEAFTVYDHPKIIIYKKNAIPQK